MYVCVGGVSVYVTVCGGKGTRGWGGRVVMLDSRNQP